MMNGYQHLGLDERRQIYQLAATELSLQRDFVSNPWLARVSGFPVTRLPASFAA